MQERRRAANIITYVVLTVLAVAFLVPIALVIMNSFKNKLYISDQPLCAARGGNLRRIFQLH